MSPLGELRAQVAGALAGLAPAGDDWPVHEGPADSVTPPCFVIVWPDPGRDWLAPQTVCGELAAVDVIMVAARIEPTPGYEQLEAMAAAALPAFGEAGITYLRVGGPGPFDAAGITYLAARMNIRQPIQFAEVQ